MSSPMQEADIRLSDWCLWENLEEGKLIVRSLNFLPLSLVNGIRRVLLLDLPALGFDIRDMEVLLNTTQFNSEDLCRRLAAVPLVCQEPSEWNPEIEPVIEFKAELGEGEKGPKMVTSATLIDQARTVGLEISNADIDLVELIRGVDYTHDPKVHIKARATVNTPRYHALYQVITCNFFRHLPNWELELTNQSPEEAQYWLVAHEIREQRRSEIAKLAVERERFIAVDRDVTKDEVMGYPMCCEMTLGGSVGSMDVLVAFTHAVKILSDIITKFVNLVENPDNDGSIEWIGGGPEGMIHLEVNEADHTLGNCIKQAFLDELRNQIQIQLDESLHNSAWRDSIAHYSCLIPSEYKMTLKLKAASQIGVPTKDIMLNGLEKYVARLQLTLRELKELK